ncbi:ATP-binding protein [Galbibacter sp.]|uniref:PAS domain-containing sensor histidine kinase n=1 Tax=Galbibacter sp. TaxID=2918471 RepID=UPI003A8DFDD2
MNVETKKLDQTTFVRLERLFLITITCIGICFFVGYGMVNTQLEDQENNTALLNTTLKQRILSQKISKALVTTPYKTPEKVTKVELSTALTQWKGVHTSLIHKLQDLKTQDREFIPALDESFKDYYTAVKSTIEQLKTPSQTSAIQTEVEGVLKLENKYLGELDPLIKLYQDRIEQNIQSLQTLLIVLLALGVVMLLVGFFIILRPAAKYSSKIIKELLSSERTAQEKARSSDILSQEKQHSVNQLQTLNSVMEQSLLYARIDPQGYIISAGSKFSRFFNYNPNDTEIQFSELIAKEERDQEYFNNILSTHKNTGWQGEIQGSNPKGEPCWFEISINPYHGENNDEALLVICFDITQRKKAEMRISQLTKEHFELEMNRQKELSSKIIENQEQEQDRIAKDIHDGIGQMLTGLKFTIESVQPNNIEATAEKVEQLKNLTSEIITGVRSATFNLSPPELADYGIAASLSKLSQELSKFTGKEIITTNKTDFNLRLEPLVEINIYRIVQEAVNNAIKYAESSQIIISISHSEDMLSIVIDDNGKGFDPQDAQTQDTHQGMGITFMKERIAYINGRLYISSSEKVGTRVTLNIPV